MDTPARTHVPTPDCYRVSRLESVNAYLGDGVWVFLMAKETLREIDDGLNLFSGSPNVEVRRVSPRAVALVKEELGQAHHVVVMAVSEKQVPYAVRVGAIFEHAQSRPPPAVDHEVFPKEVGRGIAVHFGQDGG